MRYGPRRSSGLPPGQGLLSKKPRFTDTPNQAPPDLPAPELAIRVDGQDRGIVTEADLEALGLDDYRFDFHCVATWSVKDLTWTGVPLREVVALFGLDEETRPYLVARAADRPRPPWRTAPVGRAGAVRLQKHQTSDQPRFPPRPTVPSRKRNTSEAVSSTRTTPDVAELAGENPVPTAHRTNRSPGRTQSAQRGTVDVAPEPMFPNVRREQELADDT
jgi:hypothetical protein